MKKHGPEMSMSRKLEIVRTVLSKSKGLTMLHGENLVNHVARSVKIYELPTKEEE
jgi:hypothetical protein